ncbi:phosphatase PAP2 family protein [Bosea sp. (in: a-proteobacteria)]|uniref:phosphatase PAP2 family protein n=1 Tax=Bosea sp. (in: a-proteobacteria) TaxID=1871050 RepID=UPI002B47FBD4|nr:phosphatase PAP2 family protein [Bosea sp. (in: a-proteobacteria)]WRH57818.1 MAG: phosphatase PAP2 family protein [Bosea sp. (in: a-proteobacteria)]
MAGDGWRASRTLWALIGAISLLSLAIWSATGVGLKAGDLLVILGVVASLLAISAFYSQRRPDERLARLTRAMAELLLLIFMVGSLSYSGTSLAMPLRDEWFQAMDVALGFDWRFWLSVLDAHPAIHEVLVLAYHSMLPQTALLPIVLAAIGAYRHIDRFLLSYALAAIVTVAIATLLPALSPVVHLGITPADHPNIVLAVPLEFAQHAQALREGSMKLVDLNGAQGLVTFPSFHTVSAVLLMLGFWAAPPYWRWFGVGLNGLMLVAIPIEGSHYLVDVIAGAALAVAAWAAAAWLLARERQRTAPAGRALAPVTAV